MPSRAVANAQGEIAQSGLKGKAFEAKLMEELSPENLVKETGCEKE